MNVQSFYGSKKKKVTAIRPLPEESDDSELDSTTSDEEWTYESEEDDTSSSSSGADEMYESDESNEPSSSGHQVPSANKPRWRSVLPGDIAAAPPVWLDSLPPPPSSLPEPLDYFSGFLTEQTLMNIVTESNRYAIQKNPNKPLNLTMSELHQFIGILFYMSFLRFPSTRMYWSKECRFPKIADIMSVNRFEFIKSNIHVNNNDKAVPQGEEGHDRLFKVRPLVSAVLHEFNKLPQSENLCVDEQIIPFKGKSTLKQYMPKKPKRWGYKLFVLSDVHGIMYNFEFYTGKIHLPNDHKAVGVSGHLVLLLAEIIPHERNYKLFFDNWFTSTALQIALAKKGIQCIGTVRSNRITGCTILNDKVLKKRAEGHMWKCLHQLMVWKSVPSSGMIIMQLHFLALSLELSLHRVCLDMTRKERLKWIYNVLPLFSSTTNTWEEWISLMPYFFLQDIIAFSQMVSQNCVSHT